MSSRLSARASLPYLQRAQTAALGLVALDVVGEKRHEGEQHGLKARQERGGRQTLVAAVLRHRQDRLRDQTTVNAKTVNVRQHSAPKHTKR